MIVNILTPYMKKYKKRPYLKIIMDEEEINEEIIEGKRYVVKEKPNGDVVMIELNPSKL